VQGELFGSANGRRGVEKHRFRVILNAERGGFDFEWRIGPALLPVASGRLLPHPDRGLGASDLHWQFESGPIRETDGSPCDAPEVKALLDRIFERLPIDRARVELFMRLADPLNSWASGHPYELVVPSDRDPLQILSAPILEFARMLAGVAKPAGSDPLRVGQALMQSLIGRRVAGSTLEARPSKPSSIYAPRREEKRRQETPRRSAEVVSPATKPKPVSVLSGSPQPPLRPPPPPVPLRIEPPELAFQETALPLSDLRTYLLRERAVQWWVSNQSDDLLALPYCRIEHLEYQIRSALRIIGPLRGRALLSDEVGLGKTIEAGLVLKEWLTRGMVKRFLVLTVPSLVDQWEEELADKFAIRTATTNHPEFRANAALFWREGTGLVASLATLRQPAHLEVARGVNWDLIIVDEAHHLRNRESQSWQAVNVLPRQFLLLLTATPVQNSLEELYNLVTLLQPGQLPTPKEFRARFMDPKHPRRPREPEELRRLLGQVMIRNTRANAGIQLPPRRAETVLFEPTATEQAFWTAWESELRTELAQLNPGQASLWGRLLLQAAGSSPAAWSSAMSKFPKPSVTQSWRDRAPLGESWRRKCQLIQPLTRAEGGLVIFTQFLATQQALAEELGSAGIQVFVIHGGTPAATRQPITERFRKEGGALVLTHCGTEGRNLQFCHSLVNFDLPWNPMEIEQRIGRLHRLGQTRAVQIYNLVQAGTLQEHLLEILQEKLNLFELVVGEAGLVLGERFGSDEFAEEILRRWRESDGRVGEALKSLGQDLASARDAYQQVKHLDETLFAKDYEAL